MGKLFSNKSFILLFAGNLVSEIGNSLFSLALSFYILDLTGSGLGMGAFLFVVMGSRILASPLAGVLVDRWNRVRVIYMMDYIRGVVFILLLLFIMSNPSNQNIIISLYVVGIISNVSAAFFGPAMTSALPEIVGEDNLQAANGAQSIVSSVQNIVGVLAGAAIYYYVGIEWVILLNAISFILSGFSEMFIKTKYRVEKTKEELEHQKTKSMTEDFVESLHYMKKRTGLLNLVFYSLILNFAFSPLFAIGIPYLLNTDLARVNAEMEYAYSNVAFSIAMLLAGLTVGSMKLKSIHKTLQKGLLSLSSAFAYVAFIMFLVSNRYMDYSLFYILFIVGMVFIAVAMMFTNVPLNTGMVKVIEPNYRGRVFSTIGAISGGAVPISFLVGGFIIEYLNISFLGLFCVLVILYPTFGFITNKKVKMLVDSIDIKTVDMTKIQEASL